MMNSITNWYKITLADKNASGACRKIAPRVPIGNGGSHPREGCTVFPRVLSPLSRRILSVQRPDSIDPHLLTFAFTSLPRRKEIPRTRKRGSRKPGTMDSTDLLPRVLEGCPMTHVYTRGNPPPTIQKFLRKRIPREGCAKPRQTGREIRKVK